MTIRAHHKLKKMKPNHGVKEERFVQIDEAFFSRNVRICFGNMDPYIKAAKKRVTLSKINCTASLATRKNFIVCSGAKFIIQLQYLKSIPCLWLPPINNRCENYFAVAAAAPDDEDDNKIKSLSRSISSRLIPRGFIVLRPGDKDEMICSGSVAAVDR